MAYLETSAALNINIDKVFEMLSGKIYQIYKVRNVKKLSNRISVLSAINDDPKTKKKKCCEWPPWHNENCLYLNFYMEYIWLENECYEEKESDW